MKTHCLRLIVKNNESSSVPIYVNPNPNNHYHRKIRPFLLLYKMLLKDMLSHIIYAFLKNQNC